MDTNDSVQSELRALLEKDPPANFVGFEAPKIEITETVAETTEPKVETTEAPVSTEAKVEQPIETTEAAKPTTEVETPKVEVPETPSFDYAKKLEELSGGKIKSEEDLARLLQEREELASKLEQGTYKTEFARKLDEWVDAGLEPELFYAVQGLEVDELSAEETIKSHMRITNPEYNEREIDLLFDSEYKQSDNYTEYDKEVGAIKMKSDATKAYNELKSLQDMTVVEDAKAQKESNILQQQQIEQERQTTWNSNLPKLVGEFSEFKYKLNNGEEAKYVLSKEQLAKLESAVKQAVMNVGVQYNEQSIEAVRELIKKELFAQNHEDIIRVALTTASSKATEAIAKEIHNPSALRTSVTTQAAKPSSEDEAIKRLSQLF